MQGIVQDIHKLLHNHTHREVKFIVMSQISKTIYSYNQFKKKHINCRKCLCHILTDGLWMDVMLKDTQN